MKNYDELMKMVDEMEKEQMVRLNREYQEKRKALIERHNKEMKKYNNALLIYGIICISLVIIYMCLGVYS